LGYECIPKSDIDDMSLQEEIVRALDSPKELEATYRKDPAEFTRVFPEIFSKYPDSVVLHVRSFGIHYI